LAVKALSDCGNPDNTYTIKEEECVGQPLQAPVPVTDCITRVEQRKAPGCM
jgi:hypothetical protein